MDESFPKRARKTHTRVASTGEKNQAIFSSTHSPSLMNNFSSHIPGHENKRATEHPFALNNSSVLQNKSVNIKKKPVPPVQSNNVFHFEQFLASIEKTKAGALSLRIETPTSGRKSYSSVDKPMTRTQSRTRKDSKEQIEKIVNASQFSQVHRRAASNPRVSPNASGYSNSKISVKGSSEKEKKLYVGDDNTERDVKISYLKQAWMPLNAPATSLARPGLTKTPLRLVNKKDENSFRDKKTTYKQSQLSDSNFLSNFSQLEKSYIKLKNSSHCLELEEPKPGANLSKDLQKLGFRLKHDQPAKKFSGEAERMIEKSPQRPQEVQRPHEPPQILRELRPDREVVESKFSKTSKVTKLDDKDTAFNVRPLDTEEIYEDFFDTSRMVFDFERTRVMLRSGKLKDTFTPEPKRRPSINRTSANRNSDKEISLNMSSSKQFDDKSLRVKNFG